MKIKYHVINCNQVLTINIFWRNPILILPSWHSDTSPLLVSSFRVMKYDYGQFFKAFGWKFGNWRKNLSRFSLSLLSIFFFFSIWDFFKNHSRITILQEKEEGISLIAQYHFHPLHRELDISRAITTESSPLHIGSSRTRTANLRFPSASH